MGAAHTSRWCLYCLLILDVRRLDWRLNCLISPAASIKNVCVQTKRNSSSRVLCQAKRPQRSHDYHCSSRPPFYRPLSQIVPRVCVCYALHIRDSRAFNTHLINNKNECKKKLHRNTEWSCSLLVVLVARAYWVHSILSVLPLFFFYFLFNYSNVHCSHLLWSDMFVVYWTFRGVIFAVVVHHHHRRHCRRPRRWFIVTKSMLG